MVIIENNKIGIQEENEADTENENKIDINDKNKIQYNDKKGKHSNEKSSFNFLKIIKRIFEGIGIAIILLALIILLRALIFKEYSFMGHRFYIIMSGSMEEAIHVGDGIVVKEVKDANTLKVGDVIVFDTSEGSTAHRIVKTYTEGENKLFRTKGDANNTQDKVLVKMSQVRGKVLFRVPKIGKALLFFRKHMVIILLLFFALLIIIELIRRLVIGARENEEE
ncbi:MAG: signal peptidase I [Clostridiales bacterium]|nr:signal peptidase I [Clostridiales bacterium]